MSDAASRSPERKLSLSKVLRELCETPDDDAVTVGEIVERLGRRSFGALLFIFAIPNILPLPPGGTTIFGAPLLLIAPQVAFGARAPWLPKTLRERHLRGSDLDRIFGRVLPKLEAAERLSRARLTVLFGPIGDRIIGLVCTVLAVVIVLPIPLGNLAPGISVAILSLALFQRDGVLAILGYVAALLSAGLLALGAGAAFIAVRQLIGFFGG